MNNRIAKKIQKRSQQGVLYRHDTFEKAMRRLGMVPHVVYVNSIHGRRVWWRPPGYDAFGRWIGDGDDGSQEDRHA